MDLIPIEIPAKAGAAEHALNLLKSRGRTPLEVFDVYSAGDRRAQDVYGIPRDTILWRNSLGQPMTSTVVVDLWDGESDEASRVKLSTSEGWN